jgi:hypothetical protein
MIYYDNAFIQYMYEREKKILSYFSEQRNLTGIEWSLADSNINFASFALEKNDCTSARNYYYKASMMVVKALKLPQKEHVENIIENPFYGFYPAILCDNKEILQYFLTDEIFTKGKENELGYFFIKAVQSLINKDFDSAINFTRQLDNRENKRGRQNKFTMAMHGLSLQDKKLTEQGLKYLFANRNFNFSFTKNFAIEAAVFMKIAKLIDFPLDIESPYVPKDIIEIKPLDVYEGYEFFPKIHQIIQTALNK